MNLDIATFPPAYAQINHATQEAGFSMASDTLTGSLLRTLAASKPDGRLLELGTGTGLSTAWILDGMDANATLTSVDNDPTYLAIARTYLGYDPRLTLLEADGGEWLSHHATERFDYIFADTWHGKYLLLDETLAMLKPGGLYIIDDMLPQPNWPEGHAEKATQLLRTLDQHPDLLITRLVWATGIVVGVKRST
jgi:predicted O-methyltransferase YrrM